MLKLGSHILVKDNSGAQKIKILHLKKKKTYKHASVSYSALVKGVIKKSQTNKKLKQKDLLDVVISGVKKKSSRLNGFYIQFNHNFGIPIIKKIHLIPIATRLQLPIGLELKRHKLFKLIIHAAKKVI